MPSRAAEPEAPTTTEPAPVRIAADALRLFVENVVEYALFLLDPDGRVATWNAGAERIHGYDAHEIVGRHVSTFYPEEDAGAGKCAHELAVAAEVGRFEDEGWRIRRDGTRFWASVVITAIRDARGELIGFGKVTRDLSERRRVEEALRQSEERFRLMVEGVRDYAIFMLDPTGHIVTWNPGAERIKGWTAREIVGRHFSRFYPPEDVAAGKCERALRTAAAEGKWEEEGFRVRKDGTRFWASVVITALRDEHGRLVGFGKITRDLTERKAAEDERLRLAEARQEIRLRDDFLSIASHELKTPLTALQLQLQSLREVAKSLDAKIATKVERAVRSSDRLVALVETLLDVSRISIGQLALERARMDLVDAVRDVCDRIHEAARAAGVDVVLRIGEPVVGDWDRIRIEQVVSNLVANAIKYGRGAPIEITVERDDAEARVSVTDRGPGIPEADLTRIFGRFERAASSRHYGGLGLGLYVSRQLAEAHGGRIEVENVAGAGARFVLHLPHANDAQQIRGKASA